MKAPSTALLRALLRPTTRCSQTRHVANWMPRERYAKTTSLDKLHKKQKANNRLERQNSAKRAQSMVPPSFATPAAVESNQPSDIPSSEYATTHTPSPSSTSPDSNLAPSTLPYFIHRTRTKNIPVYESHKAGGSKHITTIRKCAGDLSALQIHILEALKLEPSFVDPKGNKKHNVVINRLTNQLVVRGWRGAEIKKWCELAGF